MGGKGPESTEKRNSDFGTAYDLGTLEWPIKSLEPWILCSVEVWPSAAVGCVCP